MSVARNEPTIVGHGKNAATALAMLRERCANHYKIEPGDITFIPRGRIEKSALRAEQRLQRKLRRWDRDAEVLADL